MPSVSETGTNMNHSPVGQSWNDNYSDSQVIFGLMDNGRPDGTQN